MSNEHFTLDFTDSEIDYNSTIPIPTILPDFLASKVKDFRVLFIAQKVVKSVFVHYPLFTRSIAVLI